MQTSLFRYFLLFWIFALPVHAAETGGASGEVIIGAPAESSISELRINGQLYMIRVTPNKGPSYYLVDSDGDGSLETRRNELDSGLLIPSWVLKRW